MNTRNQKDSLKINRELKKPYRKPQLEIYGNLVALTRTIGLMGAEDNPAVTHATHTSL